MHSLSTNSLSFYGKTRFMSCNSDGKAKRISDCPFGTAYFGETKGLSEFVKKHSYPFAMVEETVGKLHDNKTYKIYVADPKEIVNDFIKRNHDYIVYDNEPNFPDIKMYFDTKQEDINKGLKVVSDYYKRLENSSIISGDINAQNLSIEKQGVANTCFKIFDEVADLRIRKSTLEQKMLNRLELIEKIEEDLTKFKKEIVRRKHGLIRKECELLKKEESLNKLIKKREALNKKVNKDQNKIDEVNANIRKYEAIISDIKNRIQKYNTRIKYLEQYIESAPKNNIVYKSDVKTLKQEIADIKQALIPNFKKLKEFYTVNGIKIIKRV